MQKRFGVVVVGGSGYGAGELVRLLLAHPEIEVAGISSRTHAGKPIHTVHTHLHGVSSLVFDAVPSLHKLKGCERGAVILAMPSGQAVPCLAELSASGLDERTVVIDLSGDLRLKDRAVHERFYPEVPFAPEVREAFSYEIPEMAPPRARAPQRISNPGCLATAAVLALAPIKEGVLTGSIVIDAKTGTSGAGREPQASMHHPSRALDFTAYKALSHRHEPEIVQALGERFAREHGVMFVPHLIPVPRGIFVTVYGELAATRSAEAALDLYPQYYAGGSFVRIRSAPPRLADVVGTNFCDISVVVRDRHIVVMSAIDNLGKGMAGQAIQNLNRAFGLSEEMGLLNPALGPV